MEIIIKPANNRRQIKRRPSQQIALIGWSNLKLSAAGGSKEGQSSDGRPREKFVASSCACAASTRAKLICDDEKQNEAGGERTVKMPRIGAKCASALGLVHWVWLLVVLLAAPVSAHATSADWTGGSPCKVGVTSYTVCSTEPKVTAAKLSAETSIPCLACHANFPDNEPCYFADHEPNPVQIDFAAVCEAAKSALGASSQDRSNALSKIGDRGTILSDDIDQYPRDAKIKHDTLVTVGHDLMILGVEKIAYSASDSPSNWQKIARTLLDLITDSSSMNY